MRLAARTLFFVVITILFLFPIVYLIYISFKPSNIIVSLPTQWTFDPVLEHYKNVLGLREFELRGVNFVKPLLNSIVIATASTLLTILIGTPAAYSLARLSVRGRSDIMLFVLASRMAPAVVLLVPYFVIYEAVGLIDSHLGLVVAYLTFNLSFYVWLLAVLTRDIPRDLEQASQTDGYPPGKTFFKIMLPLMRPGIIATAVLVFIFAWNEFAFALQLGGNNAETLPVAISRLVTPRGVLFGELGAIGAMALVPVAVLVFFLYKHIVRGLSLGAVRG